MNKDVCTHKVKAAWKPGQQPIGYQIVLSRDIFYWTIMWGIMDMVLSVVGELLTWLTKDILDFVLLKWDSDFFSK